MRCVRAVGRGVSSTLAQLEVMCPGNGRLQIIPPHAQNNIESIHGSSRSTRQLLRTLLKDRRDGQAGLVPSRQCYIQCRSVAHVRKDGRPRRWGGVLSLKVRNKGGGVVRVPLWPKMRSSSVPATVPGILFCNRCDRSYEYSLLVGEGASTTWK